MISVAIHRHVGGPRDITDYVERVTVRNAVANPWGSVSLDLVVPTSSPEVGAITPGDWIVVKDEGITLGWGIVPFQAHNTIGGGAIDASGRNVNAISWLDFLGHVDVVKSPVHVSGGSGTMFSGRDWQRVIAAAFRGLSGELGDGLAKTVEALARLRLPPSLGGGYVGESVRVVHNDATAAAYGPGVTVDPVIGHSTSGYQTTLTGQGRALAMLLAAFAGDSNVMELYPALARGGSFAREVVDTSTVNLTSDEELDRLDPFGATRRALLRRSGFAPSQPGGTRAVVRTRTVMEDAPAAMAGLGAAPIIVYRMVPWRPQALYDWVEETVARMSLLTGSDGAARELGRATAERFSKVTWPTLAHRDFPADQVYKLSRSQGLSDDYNAVTISFPNQPDSDIKWAERLGLPIFLRTMIERYGLRVFTMQWPFISAADGDSMQDHMLGLAWQAAQWYLGAGRFLRGSATVRYTPSFAPGNSFSVGMPGADGLVGYADAVGHEIAVEGGVVTRTTTIEYSRGIETLNGDDRGRRLEAFVYEAQE